MIFFYKDLHLNSLFCQECDDSSIISPDKIKKEPYVREDPKTFKHKKVSKDVEQGRTLFISGLSIDTSQLSVESVLGKFGEIKYVALVLDKLTEQPKGTAFAQFKVSCEVSNRLCILERWIGYFFLGHNEDNFLKFWPELLLTYAVNFFKGRFIIKKASYLCTMCIYITTKNLFYLLYFLKKLSSLCPKKNIHYELSKTSLIF